jgi:hypothetical protein
VIYIVEQTIARKRTVRVAASSAKEAMTKARDGYGEIIKNDQTGKLLSSHAEKEEVK